MERIIDFRKYKEIREERWAALEYVNKFRVAGVEYQGLVEAGRKFLTIREAIETALGKR
jgi:hypothetical protein